MAKKLRRRPAQERTTPKAALQQEITTPEGEIRQVHLLSYTITSEPIEERMYKRLPQQVKDDLTRLHYDAMRRPYQAIPELLALIEKYPHLPMLYNFLSVAYDRSGQSQRAEETIRRNYQQNPDYLFARLNLAEILLLRGAYEEIAELFEHKFDLKLLYPWRDVFHISEAANFIGFMGRYFLATGQRDVAERYYKVLEQLGPDFEVTMLLRQSLSADK